MQLVERLMKRDATVGVLGLGYVGLPLARAFAEAGYKVIGFDVDDSKVKKLERGESYIQAVPTPVLQQLREKGRFRATSDFERIRELDAMSICVPTPLTEHKDPDTSFIEKTGDAIAPRLKAGQLVVLESTTYPGTTDEVLRPRLEKVSGLKAGKDFYLAFSPERENPGQEQFRMTQIPKVVGADDPDSRRAVAELYRPAVAQIVEVGSTRVAEATKLLENIYRCVNIALVNELKMLFDRMKIDVFEVIEAAKTKPFGFQAFYPGPGLGGHCIPLDPVYLSWKAREFDMTTRFIELAGEVNTRMPEWVVEKCMDTLNDRGKCLKGSRVLMLGVAYKKDIDDVRESPALELFDLLRAKGATVVYHDPHIARVGRGRHYEINQESVALDERLIAEQDLVLIVTDHSKVDYAKVCKHAKLVVDTRNATKDVRRPYADKVVLA
ncbi:MAG TPA: nucleotide sugar dehydrogenase [Planctomycetota bacterium]|nr:nucleotide sugar dehydrogenase [Planctomycetota bacterium]